jgi:hypothetical protein
VLGGPALPLFAVCNSKKRGKVGGLGSFRERSQSQVNCQGHFQEPLSTSCSPPSIPIGGPSLLFQKVNFLPIMCAKKKSKKKG